MFSGIKYPTFRSVVHGKPFYLLLQGLSAVKTRQVKASDKDCASFGLAVTFMINN